MSFDKMYWDIDRMGSFMIKDHLDGAIYSMLTG